jgi:hypothetical protein
LGITSMPPEGVCIYEDANPPVGRAFYRAVWPPSSMPSQCQARGAGTFTRRAPAAALQVSNCDVVVDRLHDPRFNPAGDK